MPTPSLYVCSRYISPTYSCPLRFFLVPPPLQAPAVQQLAKQFRLPRPIVLARSLLGAAPPSNSRPPAARQAAPPSPLTPNPYLVRPLLMPRPRSSSNTVAYSRPLRLFSIHFPNLFLPLTFLPGATPSSSSRIPEDLQAAPPSSNIPTRYVPSWCRPPFQLSLIHI